MLPSNIRRKQSRSPPPSSLLGLDIPNVITSWSSIIHLNRVRVYRLEEHASGSDGNSFSLNIKSFSECFLFKDTPSSRTLGSSDTCSVGGGDDDEDDSSYRCFIASSSSSSSDDDEGDDYDEEENEDILNQSGLVIDLSSTSSDSDDDSVQVIELSSDIDTIALE